MVLRQRIELHKEEGILEHYQSLSFILSVALTPPSPSLAFSTFIHDSGRLCVNRAVDGDVVAVEVRTYILTYICTYIRVYVYTIAVGTGKILFTPLRSKNNNSNAFKPLISFHSTRFIVS